MPVVKCNDCESLISDFHPAVGPAPSSIVCRSCGAELATVILTPKGRWRPAPGYELGAPDWTPAELAATTRAPKPQPR